MGEKRAGSEGNRRDVREKRREVGRAGSGSSTCKKAGIVY